MEKKGMKITIAKDLLTIELFFLKNKITAIIKKLIAAKLFKINTKVFMKLHFKLNQYPPKLSFLISAPL